MPYKDKAKQRAFQLNAMKARRAEYFEGKSCLDCGSTVSLELDHRDPTQKESHRIWSWSRVRIEAEISKCDIRCSKCHRGRHAIERQRHGRERWAKGCRCVVCVSAIKAASARWRQNARNRRDGAMAAH